MEESDFNRLTITYDNIIGKLVHPVKYLVYLSDKLKPVKLVQICGPYFAIEYLTG